MFSVVALLSGIVLKPERSFVDAIISTKTQTPILAMACEVLSGESDGVEFVTHFASQKTALFIDPHNNTVDSTF